MAKEKQKKTSEIIEPDFIEYSYKQELIDDSTLNNILKLCETLYMLPPTQQVEDTIYYCMEVIDEKTQWLEGLQETFELSNIEYRLTDISKYLTAFTVGEVKHTALKDFEYKISMLLDVLYSNHTILYQYYVTHFKKDINPKNDGLSEISEEIAKLFLKDAVDIELADIDGDIIKLDESDDIIELDESDDIINKIIDINK